MKRFIQTACFLVLLVLTIIPVQNALAQNGKVPVATDPVNDSFDISKNAFVLPAKLPPGKYTQQLSIIYVVLPKDWTLDVINAPMFSYAGKYTLPAGFNLQASLATLFISYRLLLGPFWNFESGHYHFGAGWQPAFNFGILNQFGFRTKLVIWEQQPSVLVGYSFKKMAVTLRGELIWTNAIYESQGGHVIPYNTSFLNGYGISATLEQRLWKNKMLNFTFKLSDVRYHIIAWPAFPVNQYRYWVPEFQLGLKL